MRPVLLMTLLMLLASAVMPCIIPVIDAETASEDPVPSDPYVVFRMEFVSDGSPVSTEISSDLDPSADRFTFSTEKVSVKEGCVFKGWSTVSGASEPNVGDEFTVVKGMADLRESETDDGSGTVYTMTLYAVFEPSVRDDASHGLSWIVLAFSAFLFLLLIVRRHH